VVWEGAEPDQGAALAGRVCLPKISSRSSSHRINNIQVVPLCLVRENFTRA
jgi:hypothetical protein